MNFIKFYSRRTSFRGTHYPSMYFYITRGSEFHDIQELAFRDAGDFQWTDLVLGSTTMVEWRLGCVSSVPRASRVPPRYTNPSRTCDLPKRFLSRTMARLNYYVAPPFTKTAVKVSRFCCTRFCCTIVISVSLLLYERLTTAQYDQSMYQCNYCTNGTIIKRIMRQLDCYWIKEAYLITIVPWETENWEKRERCLLQLLSIWLFSGISGESSYLLNGPASLITIHTKNRKTAFCWASIFSTSSPVTINYRRTNGTEHVQPGDVDNKIMTHFRLW